jgi:signal transduction histidine kinase
MACEARSLAADRRLALGIGLRAALLAGIAFGILELFATHRLYVTTVVLALLGALLLAELTAYVRRGDRMLERFIDGFIAGDFEHPASRADGTGFLRERLALERAAKALESARQRHVQEMHYLRTLLDTVSVALFVLAEDGTMTLGNPAARHLAGQEAGRLEQLPAIGRRAAQELTGLAPGERRLLRLASGQRVLAQCAQLSAAGVTRRLLSLQNIAGELDAVELKDWQDVLRVLAHEIMNLLTPIASLADSIRPRVSELAGASHDGASAQHASDVAEAVEAIARRSAGLTSFVGRYRRLAELPPPVLLPVRIADVISRIEPLMGAALAAQGIAFESQVEPPDLTVPADRDLLEQLLVNLLHNAIEACAGVARPSIRVTCSYREDTVTLQVNDSGRGIDTATLERIFVPLYTTKPGGSGIGLSLARQIAHAHGGTLEATPGNPRGATFTLVMPAHRRLASDAARP